MRSWSKADVPLKGGNGPEKRGKQAPVYLRRPAEKLVPARGQVVSRQTEGKRVSSERRKGR